MAGYTGSLPPPALQNHPPCSLVPPPSCPPAPSFPLTSCVFTIIGSPEHLQDPLLPAPHLPPGKREPSALLRVLLAAPYPTRLLQRNWPTPSPPTQCPLPGLTHWVPELSWPCLLPSPPCPPGKSSPKSCPQPSQGATAASQGPPLTRPWQCATPQRVRAPGEFVTEAWCGPRFLLPQAHIRPWPGPALCS